MNPTLLIFIPGAIGGLGLALLLLAFAPRSIRAVDVLTRYDAVQFEQNAIDADNSSRKTSERVGSWLYVRAGGIPGFTPPLRELDLIVFSPSAYYFRKFVLAMLGLVAPVILAGILSISSGQVVVYPAILCPVLAVALWFVTDFQLRAEAGRRRREFTRFVTVYLELVAVALLGNSTPDAALSAAANVSDSWVFARIRREYRIADTTRSSKWQALERLGDTVGVAALGEMARVMRMSDAQVSVREQLRAAGDKLRNEVITDDATQAARVSNQMQLPIMLTIIPVLALVLIPTVLQFLGTSNQ